MTSAGPVVLHFAAPPSIACAYGKALFTRRPALVPEGRSIPLIEAELDPQSLTRAQFDRFAAVAGGAPGHACPLTFPHVLAMPLHLAILTSPAFPVRVLGLVHIENEIMQTRWLQAGEPISVGARLEGYEDTPRGHEFMLKTDVSAAGEVVWRAASRFLARRPGKDGATASRPATVPEADPPSVATSSWHCDADIGRRYGWLSGDMNPIHLSDATAKLFGFDRAIAHGLWTLSRIAHELGSQLTGGAVRLSVRFRSPVQLPAWVMLHHWRSGPRTEFRLRGSDGERIHAEGVFEQPP